MDVAEKRKMVFLRESREFFVGWKGQLVEVRQELPHRVGDDRIALPRRVDTSRGVALRTCPS